MSFGSSYEIKEQVRQATDLVDLVSRSVNLRRQGRLFVGLCPWHDDSRPSLQVNPDRQFWKCWVCNVGGDVFSFVMKREGVDFPEALRILAERAGITLGSAAPKAAPGSPQDKPTLYRAMAWAEEQYHRCLLDAPDAAPARAYLAERGIDQESVHKFHLGFAPQAWQWLADRARGTPFTPPALEAAGLLSRTKDGQRYIDRFRGRLMFSIRDTEQRPIAFGGRALAALAREDDFGSAKYINSPETRLFTKSQHLYGLDLVRAARPQPTEIIAVEGYTDVIMAHQHGMTNVVAALGTALGQRQVSLLRRFAERITLVLDGDEAGQRRTNEVLELFVAAQVDLRILTLPDRLDPCDFLVQRGRAALDALLAGAVDALEHKAQVLTEGLDVLRDVDRAHRALEEMLRTLAAAPRAVGVSDESLRLREQQMLVRLARFFHVDEATLRARLKELRHPARPPAGGRRAATTTATTALDLAPWETELVEILLTHPPLVDAALRQIDASQLASPSARDIWQLYQQAVREGTGYQPQEILTLAEDAELKTLIVRLHEQACRKAPLATLDPAQRLDGIVRDLQLRRQEADQRRVLATLERREYDEKEELAVLQRFIEQERNRQGISAPTDG